MAVAGVKYDDGSKSSAINCFPVRRILRQSEEGELPKLGKLHKLPIATVIDLQRIQYGNIENRKCAGAWKVAYREEELRRFNACIVTKPASTSVSKAEVDDENALIEEEEGPILDGFFLLQHCCVEDPSDLCSANITGELFRFASEDDFEMFDNVAYINAGENLLPVEAYKNFPQLRELEIPFCGICEVALKSTDFKNLVMLDLSYNNLSPDSLLAIGTMRKLRVLHLTGNGLSNLPDNLCAPVIHDNKKALAYPTLEVLMLDDNKLWSEATFTQLSRLTKLQHLNMEGNLLSWVPHLKIVDKVIQAVGSTSSTSSSNHSSNRGSASCKPPESRAEHHNSESLDTNSDPRHAADQLDVDTNVENMESSEPVGHPSATPRTNFLESIVAETPPPFSELRFINLANNQFEREEAFLAVAVWPSLVDVDIHGNPLTRDRSGDPPLLIHFLHNRLGINIFRFPPAGPSKQPLRVTKKKCRQVTTYVTTVTRPSIEERMMLEFSPPHQKQMATGSLSINKPLPPIMTNVPLQQPASSDVEHSDSQLERNSQNNASNCDPFFVTQDEYHDEFVSETEVHASQDEDQATCDRAKTPSRSTFTRYEEMLKVDDAKLDGDMVTLPQDLPGSLRALKYALGHERVYRDLAVRLTKVSKLQKPLKVHPLKPMRHESRTETVNNLLAELRLKPTFTDTPLTDIFKNSSQNVKSCSQAVKLLRRIEQRYNTVRHNSSESFVTTTKRLADSLSTFGRASRIT